MLYNQQSQQHQLYYAMFARSYDKGCKNSSLYPTIHLISSVYATTNDLDLKSLISVLPKLSGIFSDSNQIIIVRVVNHPVVGVDGSDSITVINHSEFLVEYRLSLLYWLSCLSFENRQEIPNY